MGGARSSSANCNTYAKREACRRISCPAASYEKREACGVVAAYSYKHKPVAEAIYLALLAQQHRGQDGAGIAVVEGDSIEMQKGLGFLGSIYSSEPAWKLLRGKTEELKSDDE